MNHRVRVERIEQGNHDVAGLGLENGSRRPMIDLKVARVGADGYAGARREWRW